MMPYCTSYFKFLSAWFYGFPEQNKDFAMYYSLWINCSSTEQQLPWSFLYCSISERLWASHVQKSQLSASIPHWEEDIFYCVVVSRWPFCTGQCPHLDRCRLGSLLLSAMWILQSLWFRITDDRKNKSIEPTCTYLKQSLNIMKCNLENKYN